MVSQEVRRSLQDPALLAVLVVLWCGSSSVFSVFSKLVFNTQDQWEVGAVAWVNTTQAAIGFLVHLSCKGLLGVFGSGRQPLFGILRELSWQCRWVGLFHFWGNFATNFALAMTNKHHHCAVLEGRGATVCRRGHAGDHTRQICSRNKPFCTQVAICCCGWGGCFVMLARHVSCWSALCRDRQCSIRGQLCAGKVNAEGIGLYSRRVWSEHDVGNGSWSCADNHRGRSYWHRPNALLELGLASFRNCAWALQLLFVPGVVSGEQCDSRHAQSRQENCGAFHGRAAAGRPS